MDYSFARNMHIGRANILAVIFLILSLFIVSADVSAAEPVCAQVKIQIQQELTFERQAFDAMMRINNGLDTMSIENVKVVVNFKDENNNSVIATNDPNSTNPSAKFFIRVDSMDGILDVSGNGVVAPSSEAEIHWLIIPIPGAADNLASGKLFFVGAMLTYTLGGKEEAVEVTPDFITVKPMPTLALDYFLTQEVIADDAFTPEIEPPQPYTLGVRVRNKGAANATDVKIESAQPKIIENEQGLLVDFIIKGSRVGNESASPTFALNFGEIPSNTSKVGRWIMESTLSGEFVDFSATITHSDALGGNATSLIDQNDLNTYFHIHDVMVDLPGRDSISDFLAYPVGDLTQLSVYESETLDTIVQDVSGNTVATQTSRGANGAVYTIKTLNTDGFIYLKIPDSTYGVNVVKSVVRSDGKTLPKGNAWYSKTRNRDTSPPSWEYWLNLFDVNTTGEYTINVGAPDLDAMPPIFNPFADITTFEGGVANLLVQASDPNGDQLVLSASVLPAGATFNDNGNGTANFSWLPGVGQAGDYSVTFKATDGSLNTSQSVFIKVNPEWDIDGDGIDDAWERENFNDLNQDGSKDSDLDGVSDMDEYLDGTDPNLPPPAIPENITTVSGNGENDIEWGMVSGADAYRVYWSTVPGVSKQNGNWLDTTLNTTNHNNLQNGLNYYYVLTSVGPGGESAETPEFSAMPGKSDWTTPERVAGTTDVIPEFDVVETRDGGVVALWVQTDNAQQSLWANRYDQTTGWGAPQSIVASTTRALAMPQLSIDTQGSVSALWLERDGIQDTIVISYHHPDSGWSVPVTLSPVSTVLSLRSVYIQDGNVMVAWLGVDPASSDESVYTASFSAGNWTTPLVISAGNGSKLSALNAAADDQGNALIVWASTSSGQLYDLKFDHFDPASGWNGEQIIRTGIAVDPLTLTPLDARISMNSSGQAALVWNDHSSGPGVWVSRYNPTIAWNDPVRVDQEVIAGLGSSTASIDESGNVLIAWQQTDGLVSSISVRQFTTVDGWYPDTHVISAEARPGYTGDVGNPEVVLVRDNNAVVAWHQDDGIQRNILSSVYSSTDGSWAAPAVIDSKNNGDGLFPIVVGGAAGGAHVVWIQEDGPENSLWSNNYFSGNEGMPNIFPVVVAPEPSIVNEQSVISLSVAEAFDQDGSISTYSWRQTGGISVALTNAETPEVTFETPVVVADESLRFAVSVTDNEGASTEATIDVFVNPVNAPPIVDAGRDLIVNELTNVNLLASANDEDGSITTHYWEQVSGETVSLNAQDAPSLSFIAPPLKHTATLVFRYSATDNEGGQASDNVSVVVHPVNNLPIVDAGNNQAVSEQSIVSLEGMASDPDADGVLSSYEWKQLSGLPVTLSPSNTLATGFSAPTLKAPEVLVFSLSVMDDEGGVSTDSVSVTVNPVNTAPMVYAGSGQVVNEQVTVTMTGSASDPDADGQVVSYTWAQVDGAPVSLSNTHSLDTGFIAPAVKQPVTLRFRLSVVDDEGGVAFDETSVTVNPVNNLPVVDAGVSQTVDELTVVTLIGAVSDPDADGVIAHYAWQQLSGSPVVLSTSSSVSTSFTAPMLKQQEILQFKLTAIDDEGGVASDTLEITVNPVNYPPVIEAGAAMHVGENAQAELTVQVSDPDSDGVITDYQWSQVSGPSITLVNASNPVASFIAPSVYKDVPMSFHVVVTDDEGGVASSTVDVTVYSTNPDDDGDSMDDLWEVEWFGDLSRDGMGDFDGDGATELMEFTFGSDPTVAQGPGDPEIVSPDSNEVTTLQPNLVLLNGKHHPDFVVTYQFEVYRDEAMTQRVTSADELTEGQETTEWVVDVPLDDNTHYYWRARALGWVLHSAWVNGSFFVNTVNDAPDAFSISSPDDGVWVDTYTPILSVSNSRDVDGDALRYSFLVYPFGEGLYTALASISDVPEGSGGITEWQLDTPLNENTWYTWKSIVTDEHDAETSSDEASFFVNTVNDAPTSPVTHSPLNDEELAVTDIELVVDNASDPDSEVLTYAFELDTADTFDTENLRTISSLPEGGVDTRWSVSGLSDNTWYYWRVKATDGMAESAWNTSRFFVNTENDAPSIPIPENPGESAWVGTVRPSLSVYPSTDVDFDTLSYQYEVYATDRKNSVGGQVASGSSETPSWQVSPALSESGWYYWRAQAVDEHDADSGWSEMVRFYIDTDGVNDAPVIRMKRALVMDGHRKDAEHTSRLKKLCQEKALRHFLTKNKMNNVVCGENRKSVYLRWHDSDPDSNAEIRLYYDTDAAGADGQLIADGLYEDPDGRLDAYQWDITDVAPGVYFVYAEIDDGNGNMISYTPNAVVVGDGGGKPYIELSKGIRANADHRRGIQIRWTDGDADSNAAISLYFDTDDQGADGTLIVSGIPEDPDRRKDRYQWDASLIPPGKYYLYAVIDDGTDRYIDYSDRPVTIRRQRGHEGRKHKNGHGAWNDKGRRNKDESWND